MTRRRRDNEEDEVDDGAVAEACEELNIKHYQKGTRTWDICKKFALKMIREDAAQQSGEDHDDEDAAEEEEEQEEEEDLQEEVQEKSRKVRVLFGGSFKQTKTLRLALYAGRRD